MVDEPIFGRGAEVDRLAAALQEAKGGRGGLWLLTGEPGIGKTRLAEECERIARSEGFACAWGACWESGGAPAFWPWTQVLRSLQRALGLPALPATLASLSAEPALRPREAVASRFELFQAVADWLGQVAAERPIWIGLEDLHAADAASLALIESLLAPLRSAAILIVGTLRSEAVSVGARRSIHDHLLRDAKILPLRRLDPAAGRALLLQTLEDLDEPLIQEAVDATAGHPLFLVELAHLAHTAPRGSTADELIPASIHNVLRRRLDGISEQGRGVLICAALMGLDVDRATLARVFGEEKVSAVLAEAQAAALIQRVGPRGWRIVHALLRDVLVEGLDAPALEQAHADIADALAASGASPSELAHHLRLAGPRHQERALQASFDAAQAALDCFAFEDALSQVASARARLDASTARFFGSRLGVLEGLALLGLGRTEAGLVACLAATERARADEDADGLARAALAYGSIYRFASIDPRLVALLEDALEALPPGDSPLKAQVLARLAAARQPDPVPERPIALAREALAMAERVQDSTTLVTTLRAASSALVDLAHPLERRELDQRHLDLALRNGLPTDALTARQRLAFDCMELGELPSALTHLEEAARLAAGGAHPRHRWRVPAIEALRRLWRGELNDTRALIEEARSLGESCGDPNAASCSTFQLARWLELAGGSDEETSRMAETLGRIVAGSPPGDLLSAMCRAGFLLQRGRRDEGLAAVDRSSVLTVAAVGDRTMVRCIALWAAASGDAEIGRLLLDKLDDQAELFISDGVVGFCWRSPLSLCLAHAAQACGDLERALRFAEHAATTSARQGGRPAETEAHLLAASLAHHLGRNEAARSHETHARKLIDDLGLAGYAQHLERLSEPLPSGLGRTPRPRPEGPASSPLSGLPAFTDEGDVVCVTWRNRSVRVQATKGLSVLAELVSRPGVSIHVLDLVHPGKSTPPVDRGDAGEVLDERARTEYRARAALLREALEEAEAHQDRGRIEAVREELSHLAEELARGTGLSGRGRRVPAAEERARQAVRKQIRTGLDRIQAVFPELARYLERSIQTGRTCQFRP